MRHNDILLALQKLKNIKPTQQNLADILGTNINTIGGRAKRNSKYDNLEVLKIGEYYGVNLLMENVKNAMITQNEIVTVTYRPDVYLSAGYGVEVYDESNTESIYIDKRFFLTDKGLPINPANCEIVTISGNSMFPEYQHGDKVIIDKSDVEFSDGQIYAFRYKGQCYIKEINLLGNKVKCISINKEYDSFYIEENEDFRVLGRIIPRVRL